MERLHRILRRPITTEKSSGQQGAANQYSFEVDRDATKPEIAAAVQRLFGVTVLQVRTMRAMGKVKRMGRFSGRRPDWKKAVVTLKEGDEIQIYDNV
ncbi:MAG: 50S ribosomal protein L23 [Gemmatimonadetes bacterium]|nr:50S ribosomal protein L23 [Gemmatimonadota bacterium]